MRTLALALLLVPGVAFADAGESALSAAIGGGTFTRPGKKANQTIGPDAGGVVGISYERGFSESFSWRVDVQGGAYLGGGMSWSAAGAAGLVYRFDVLKYVPYGMVEVGATEVGGGPIPSAAFAPVVAVGGGADWLTSRDRSWGLEARVASFAGDTTMVTVAVRATWRWGFF
jgi:hypothetical protein